MIFFTSCAPNVYDKTTTEPTTTDIATVNFQKENVKISDKFTWDDYLKYAQSEGAVIVDLENYFNAYFFVIDKSLADINIPRALTEMDATALSGTKINVADFKSAGINFGDGMIWMNDKDITLNSAE